MNYVLGALMSFFLLVGMVSAQTPITVDEFDSEAIAPSEEVEAEEIQREMNRQLDDMEKREGITRAYYGHGWATWEDEGYVIQTLWLRNSVPNLDDIPSPYREDAMISGGVLKWGTGSEAHLFRLTKVDSSPGKIVFAIAPFTPAYVTNGIEDRLVVTRSPYSEVSTWEGMLTFENADGSSMDYEVELATRSIPVEEMQDIERLMEQRNRNNFSALGFIKNLLEDLRSTFS